ncbi:MAG: hypothetical protein K0T01_2742 [Acidimicrobiia bacterium]|jgi:hypothetical protein|nr:hypothetical protein [Acidimicrobiia bacterium]
MPRRNRVDPWGDLHAVPERGLFTGNRGCLIDDRGNLARHHRGPLWIICLLEYRGWRHPLEWAGTWTPLFFLDDADALAAGHRPCGLCRRQGYVKYRDAVTRAAGSSTSLSAGDMNRRLGRERLHRGRGLDRAADRMLWTESIDRLPVGTVIVDGDRVTRLVMEDRLPRFTFGGWTEPIPRPRGGQVDVLTPPTSVAALANGYSPFLHPTASG